MPTSQKKPLVIVTRKLPDAVETRMRELFDARLNIDDKPMSQAELAEAVKTAHVLVPTVTDRIDRSLLSQAGPQLKHHVKARVGGPLQHGIGDLVDGVAPHRLSALRAMGDTDAGEEQAQVVVDLRRGADG